MGTMDMSDNMKKILLVVGIVFFAVVIIVNAISNSNTKNYNNLKQNRDEYIVYTKYEDNGGIYQKSIPYVNMKADVIKKVNQDIFLFCNDYKDMEKSVISYEYDINGIILSVVVKIVNNETEYAPEVYFKTYNINLDTEEVIDDYALLDFFKVNKNEVESKIESDFRRFYKDVTNEGYVDSGECDYDCFLSWRGIDNYLADVSYYVENGKLIAFKPFIFYSIFGEENYFSDDDFKFAIAEFKG